MSMVLSELISDSPIYVLGMLDSAFLFPSYYLINLRGNAPNAEGLCNRDLGSQELSLNVGILADVDSLVNSSFTWYRCYK